MNLNELMQQLFVNRNDCYAKAFLNKDKNKMGYAKKEESITNDLIGEHLAGNVTIGVYQLNKDKVKWVCLDFDKNTKEDYEKAQDLFIELKKQGFNPLLEMSGGGEFKCHIWIFCDTTGKNARLYFEQLCKDLGIMPHEIFPKQSQTDSYGNLVKLPLAYHLASKQRSYFLSSNFEPLVSIEQIEEKLKSHLDNIDFIPEAQQEEKPITEYKTQDKKPSEFDKFFNHILNNKLPEGITQEAQIGTREAGINNNILKNEAIWFFQKGYSLEDLEKEVKPVYDKNGWAFADLKGWYNKAKKGEIKEIAAGEIADWCFIYKPELLELLPKEDLSELETRTKFKIISDKELQELNLPKPEWYANEIIPKKAIIIIGGKRGGFKTITALHIAFAISSGNKVFDKFETKKARILYIDEENDLALVKERVEKIKKGLGIKSQIELSFINNEGVRLDENKRLAMLEENLKEFRPEIIILDSLRRFTMSKENESESILYLHNAMKRLSKAYGITWILLHHLRKGISGKNISDEMDELRGSSDLPAIADVILLLQRNKGSSESFVLKMAKSRYNQEMKSKVIQMIWEQDNLKMNCVGDAEEQIMQDELCGKAIIKYMAEQQLTEFKAAAIKEALKEHHSIPTINRALRFLKDSGKLISKKKGYYEISVKEDINKYIPGEPNE